MVGDIAGDLGHGAGSRGRAVIVIVSHSPNIGGTCSPYPIAIDAFAKIEK